MSIDSIPDLIDAREGDPEDLLFQLGFTHFEGTRSHSSVSSLDDMPMLFYLPIPYVYTTSKYSMYSCNYMQYHVIACKNPLVHFELSRKSG